MVADLKRLSFMQKKVLTYVMIFAFVALTPANAQDIDSLDLREVVLDKESTYYVPKDAPISETHLSETTSSDVSLENKSIETVKKKNEFFNIFNLKGDVVNIGGTCASGVKKLNGACECGIEEAENIIKTGIQKDTVQQWMDGDFATGKYFGARPTLENHGVSINSSMLYSPFAKTGGGANESGSARGYSVFNLGITVDTEKAGLWKGGTFFGLYQRKAGYGISGANGGAMGDYMGFDGWDWHEMNQISEYWYQQKFFKDKLRMKFGKQDSNTDFGYLNSGWDFMNSAFSVNPTTPLPTYPDQPFGFMVEISPKEWLTIKDGIYSRYSVPFNVTEIEVKPTIKKMPGRYMLGVWELSDNSGYDVAAGMNSDGSTYYNNYNRNFGAYLNFEQMVYKENKDDDNDMQGLVVFGQCGMSPSNKNDLSKYVGGGLHYLGLIPKRDKDITGIALGSGNFASRLGSVGTDYGNRNGSETVLEAFYRLYLNKWMYLQPDVQLIMNPGGMYNSSVAIGVRSVITF